MIYIATAFFLLNYIFFRSSINRYEIISTAIYLFSFTVIQQFDDLFVVYLIFFTLPLIGFFKEALFGSPIRTFIYLFFTLELLIGIKQNEFKNVFAVFLTRFYPFFLIPILNNGIKIIEEDYRKNKQALLRLLVFFEITLSMLLFAMNNEEYFVVNHQPVGANLSLIGVLIAMNIGNDSESRIKYRKENIFYLFLFMALALISGTRGYIIIVIPCALWGLSKYVFSADIYKKPLFSLSVILLFIAIIIFMNSLWMNILLSETNINLGIGYRTLENSFFLETFKELSIVKKLFGSGFGVSGEQIGGGALIRALANNSSFYNEHLGTGFAFQNFWFTALMDVGIFGFALILFIYFGIIFPKRKTMKNEKWIDCFLFMVLFFFMLIYRTSCANSLLEVYMLVVIANEPTDDPFLSDTTPPEDVPDIVLLT